MGVDINLPKESRMNMYATNHQKLTPPKGVFNGIHRSGQDLGAPTLT